MVAQTTKPAKCLSCGTINTPDPSVADFHDLLVALRGDLRTFSGQVKVLLFVVVAILALEFIAALLQMAKCSEHAFGQSCPLRL
jgi:hypothetical protein